MLAKYPVKLGTHSVLYEFLHALHGEIVFLGLISGTKKGPFGPFSIRQCFFELLFDINSFHAQSDTTLSIDFQYFDFDDIAFGKLIANLVDMLIGNLRNMH